MICWCQTSRSRLFSAIWGAGLCWRHTAALPAIAAVGRRFPEVSQANAAAQVRQLTGCDDSRSHAEFIADVQRDKTARDAVIAGLQNHALFAETPPWHTLSVSVSGIDAFL
ncbi:MAG: hypothetical protein CM15mP46_3780 [Alphaproteobacteria bacterium]|nr:MAG: hypothetical protein CM15mP46_3780 [Alphaproteobacteria bacterium]